MLTCRSAGCSLQRTWWRRFTRITRKIARRCPCDIDHVIDVACCAIVVHDDAFCLNILDCSFESFGFTSKAQKHDGNVLSSLHAGLECLELHENTPLDVQRYIVGSLNRHQKGADTSLCQVWNERIRLGNDWMDYKSKRGLSVEKLGGSWGHDKAHKEWLRLHAHSQIFGNEPQLALLCTGACELLRSPGSSLSLTLSRVKTCIWHMYRCMIEMF